MQVLHEILSVVSVSTVALAMALALAHALEMPGKMRLRREEYLAVQRIYYPGFTVGGGIGESGGALLTLALLLLTPTESSFWLILAALILLLGMQAVYWFSIHAVNRYWLQGETLGSAGGRFFSMAAGREEPEASPDWHMLRDRWERSHLVRAVLATISFVLLVIASQSNH
jgi:hypothetical protein